MDPVPKATAPSKPGGQKLMGAGVVAWAFLDPVIGIVLVVLAAWLRSRVVFVVAAVLQDRQYGIVQLAGQMVGLLCCGTWQEA